MDIIENQILQYITDLTQTVNDHRANTYAEGIKECKNSISKLWMFILLWNLALVPIWLYIFDKL